MEVDEMTASDAQIQIAIMRSVEAQARRTADALREVIDLSARAGDALMRAKVRRSWRDCK